jgi:putative Holliday junction resolvase
MPSYLGFDFGEQRIGVASGQTYSGTAQPLTTLHAINQRPDWDGIAALIAEWQPDALIVGLPVHINGTQIPLTARVQRFMRQLEGRFNLPVHAQDERLSSREAGNLIRDGRASGRRGKTRKGDVDKIAASLILQRWLDQPSA